jgi:hypothetical protein
MDIMKRGVTKLSKLDDEDSLQAKKVENFVAKYVEFVCKRKRTDQSSGSAVSR